MSGYGASTWGVTSYGTAEGGSTVYETITEALGAGQGVDALLIRSINEALLAGNSVDALLLLRIREWIAVNAPLATGAELNESVTDSFGFGDLAALVHRALVEEGFALADAAAAQFTAMHIVAETLRLNGIAGTRLEAMQLVTAGIAFGVAVDMWHKAQVSDGLTVAGSVQDALTAAMRLVESILVGGVASQTLVLGAVVTEAFAAGDDTGTVLDALALVREALVLMVRVHAEGDERIGYCINTENKALTRFTQWPFNSYGQMPATKAYYGMTPDGIRRIFDGDTTDAGAAIGARVRLSMTNLGTGREKRMEAAYLGYTATGELRIKAIVVGTDGQKEAYTYRLHRQDGGPRPARIKIGQALKSVYWGFELEAIDGAAFELDLLQLLPIVLDTRMNGEGGGLR